MVPLLNKGTIVPPLINAKGVSKHYSSKTLFEDLDISIEEGDRIGLIGANGAGKSTLLRILAQIDEADEGVVTSKKFLKLGFVKQETEFPKGQTIVEAITKAAIAGGIHKDEALVEAQIIASQMEFWDLDAVIDTLSGGWKRRLSIACTLVLDPELVILDEPTNHLDQEGWQWLQNLLVNSTFAWILTSHDRYFLERTVTKVAELSSLFPQAVLTTTGSYLTHLQKRAEYLEQLASEIQSMSTKMKREDEWLSRGPKARSTKAKYRIDAAGDLKDALSNAKSRMRVKHTKVDFTGSDRKTKKLIEAKEINKAYDGKTLFTDFDLFLGPGMRLGILGPNGSGKSTLLKTFTGDVTVDSGEISQAPNLQLTYFDQGRDSIDPNWTLKRALAEEGDAVVFRGRSINVVSWARQFLFTPEQLQIPVKELSGGERARVILARFMLQPADVLILDEPTNDLDIPTLEALEESLISFQGAIVIVSHDRYLMETVCNGFVGLLPDGRQQHYASFSQWERELRGGGKSRKKNKKSNKAPPIEQPQTIKAPKASGKKLSYIDQREYDALEGNIQKAESEQAIWQTKLSDPKIAASPSELSNCLKELEKCTTEVERLYSRFTELETKMN
jgi:ABC transport system ATP-binding/permease protein